LILIFEQPARLLSFQIIFNFFSSVNELAAKFATIFMQCEVMFVRITWQFMHYFFVGSVCNFVMLILSVKLMPNQ